MLDIKLLRTDPAATEMINTISTLPGPASRLRLPAALVSSTMGAPSAPSSWIGVFIASISPCS